ncbi:hypothetical protein NFI96_024984, partial [Prochilodus magdalenae]
IPLVIFKREKELARKLEFDGLYITEQPNDDDIKGQWDRLVLNTPSYPNNYWDKFVKRKVLDKYGDIYGRERIAELLGMDLASLDVSKQQSDKKPEEQDNSMLARSRPHTASDPTHLPTPHGSRPRTAPDPTRLPTSCSSRPHTAPDPARLPTPHGSRPHTAPDPARLPTPHTSRPRAAPDPTRLPTPHSSRPHTAPDPARLPTPRGSRPHTASDPTHLPTPHGSRPRTAPDPTRLPTLHGSRPHTAPDPARLPTPHSSASLWSLPCPRDRMSGMVLEPEVSRRLGRPAVTHGLCWPVSLCFRLTAVDIKYQIWKFGVVFTDNTFLYLVWYTVMSLLGHYNNFFFACHLLDIAMGVKTLRTILSSVTHNGKQLMMTVGLLAVVVYLYTVVAFNFFRKFYNKSEDEDEPDMKCDDMMTCYLFHMYVGVRAGGGIGDEIEDPAGDEYELYRVVFDITFFFFVIVILLAIIQGLIIDAFGELRDQQEQVKEDMETKCFICGIGSDYFDTTPHGFETHTLEEHNLANYLFFLMYLINKDETEHTGQPEHPEETHTDLEILLVPKVVLVPRIIRPATPFTTYVTGSRVLDLRLQGDHRTRASLFAEGGITGQFEILLAPCQGKGVKRTDPGLPSRESTPDPSYGEVTAPRCASAVCREAVKCTGRTCSLCLPTVGSSQPPYPRSPEGSDQWMELPQTEGPGDGTGRCEVRHREVGAQHCPASHLINADDDGCVLKEAS